MPRCLLLIALVGCVSAQWRGGQVPQFRAQAQAVTNVATLTRNEAYNDEQEAAIKDALNQISSDVMATARELKEEAKWVKDVEHILEGYQTKVTRVETDIAGSRLHLKDLLVKKRQLENIQLQKGLEIKLTDANSDLTLIGEAEESLSQKEADFQQNVVSVQGTITDLNSQLSILK